MSRTPGVGRSEQTYTPGPWMPLVSYAPELSEAELAILSALADEQKLAVAHAMRLLIIEARSDLLAALRRAVETIHAFHGMGLDAKTEEKMWELYQHSPEMQAINAAIDKAEGR